jgi:hypothetical protein
VLPQQVHIIVLPLPVVVDVVLHKPVLYLLL